ncbi:transcriptional regulator [Sphaerochaeta pleomorpha str. Grapes]|uniref:Transcriptional regulator n=1 Tax=Sphaerochaeta pleomorpha (strain ATCC BAA-1885 / DSM 22778 / Grapes) TaxID=158190 RepID=G8QXJ9_SPHPG|nr:MarR family transcriptional regulator [Sphaerochaeta pleomorpha]AEV29562.1 transcriptional regulator [Sphaerochaeta pleomorpha str. Grapes]
MEDLRLKSIIDVKMKLERLFFKQHLYKYTMPDGLNQTHMLTLLHLHFCKSSSMAELSRHLNLEKGSFTPVSNKLLQFGYIEKEQDPQDKRVFRLSLTEKGETLASDFKKSHLVYIQSLLDTLAEEEKEKFFQAVGFLNDSLQTFFPLQ